jgi:hypothetical protein
VIDEMLATGRAPIPAERTLIVSGILDECLPLRHDGHQRRETPHLSVAYRALVEAQHARG